MTSLREAALAAYEAEVQRRAEEDRKNEERARQWEIRTLKLALRQCLDLDITPTTDRITIDGLTFVARYDGNEQYRLVLVMPCASCGQEVFGHSIRSLTNLGEALGRETRICTDCQWKEQPANE